MYLELMYYMIGYRVNCPNHNKLETTLKYKLDGFIINSYQTSEVLSAN